MWEPWTYVLIGFYYFCSTGLDFDGLYRVSGNLSMIQKLRIMVDQGRVDFGF